jgi:hypothetical protein
MSPYEEGFRDGVAFLFLAAPVIYIFYLTIFKGE